jgi:hypothetical protein
VSLASFWLCRHRADSCSERRREPTCNDGASNAHQDGDVQSRGPRRAPGQPAGDSPALVVHGSERRVGLAPLGRVLDCGVDLLEPAVEVANCVRSDLGSQGLRHVSLPPTVAGHDRPRGSHKLGIDASRFDDGRPRQPGSTCDMSDLGVSG